jgi:DNA-binding NarL/FixJ family response regulator
VVRGAFLNGDQMTAFKILIVEDSNHYRQLLKETLHSGFPKTEIVEAIDGEEALQKIKALLPQLVFMDIRLPGESGLEITRKIKTQYPDISVIILTSYDLPEYREAAHRYKADYFLPKGSTSTEDILKLVQSILSSRNIGFNTKNNNGLS